MVILARYCSCHCSSFFNDDLLTSSNTKEVGCSFAQKSLLSNKQAIAHHTLNSLTTHRITSPSSESAVVTTLSPMQVSHARAYFFHFSKRPAPSLARWCFFEPFPSSRRVALHLSKTHTIGFTVSTSVLRDGFEYLFLANLKISLQQHTTAQDKARHRKTTFAISHYPDHLLLLLMLLVLLGVVNDFA